MAAPTRPSQKSRSRGPQRAPDLNGLSESALLELRLCDLGLRLRATELQSRIERLYGELAGRGLMLRPHAWLSTEWFAPDGVPGFAIPFYLAHPRLSALERRYMHEVEGGTERGFYRLLRHEAGHTMDSAFRLHERADWQEHFGSFNAPYHQRYQPRPFSRRFVRNLDDWYAQSHPAEDFAETVAVWLDPDSNWRSRYRDWPAMRKLSYVNRLMRELSGITPTVRSRVEVEPISELRLTVAEYYKAKRRRYRVHLRDVYARDLRELFGTPRDRRSAGIDAASYLRSVRPKVRERVAGMTGASSYFIDRLLGQLIECSAELDIRVDANDARLQERQLQQLARKVSAYLAQGHARFTR